MKREEAIEVVNGLWRNEKEREAFGVLIPELAESEDERIIDFLIAYFSKGIWETSYPFSPLEIRNWLEKQKEQKGSLRVIKDASEWEKIKEQKPAEWSEEDDGHIDAICRALTDNMSNIGFYTTETLCFWLKSLRPHWKPSEEQMDALEYFLGNGGKYDEAALESLYDDLKKLH